MPEHSLREFVHININRIINPKQEVTDKKENTIAYGTYRGNDGTRKLIINVYASLVNFATNKTQ
ncbi:MAG TPA: hypothetical protein VFG46_03190 [Chryseolinea sp.]|nr:hypothetical protein [Chryseolinea sp.]